jgi:hypothetical protein
MARKPKPATLTLKSLLGKSPLKAVFGRSPLAAMQKAAAGKKPRSKRTGKGRQ